MNSLNLNFSLNFNQLLKVVKQLTPAEKLKLNDCIWEDDFEIPAFQQKIVLERIKESKQNKDSMVDWEDAMKTLTTK
jgi:Putative addiction module component